MTAPARLTRPLIFGLAGMAALASMAVHLFVPAMPLMVADLAARPDEIQLSITLFVVGMGLGQLVAGPAADRYGRKPVMMAGLLLFTAGSIACGAAATIELLIPARVVQALGGAATLVAVRTALFDRAPAGAEAAALASLTGVILLSPAVAPIAGGALAAIAGWRSIFWVLAALGLVAALASMITIAETRRSGAGDAGLRRNLGRLARNGVFLRYTGGVACLSTVMYLFLSNSAFLLIDRWQLTPTEAGVCYAMVAGAGILGTTLVKHAERRGGAIRIGYVLVCGGAATMLAVALAGLDSPVALVAPMVVVTAGSGMANPATLAQVMRADPAASGTAASLAGACQMMASGIVTSIVARIHPEALSSIAACMLVTGLVGFALVVRRA